MQAQEEVRKTRRKWYAANRERNRAYNRKYREAERRAYQRDGHLLRVYGIDAQQYERMLEEQGGVCAICQQPETRVRSRIDGKPDRLSVDHDHATGQVRSLLCHRCNQLLGLLRDSQELLEAAANYLKEHKKRG